MPDTNPFAALDGEQYILLTTYRKSGEPLPTPVWFAERDGRLYITTSRTAGKVKRVRNNPRVLVAPSDRIGVTHGPAIAAAAREVNEVNEAARGSAEAALLAKYGDQLARFRAMRSPLGSTYIEVTPERREA